MSKRLFKTMVAVLAIAAAAAGPAWGQTTYNVTFGGFSESEMNTTVNVASLPQTFTTIGHDALYPWTVISTAGNIFFGATVTSGGEGKVSVSLPTSDEMTITVSGPFEGTATIHVTGEDDENRNISCDITVSCVAAGGGSGSQTPTLWPSDAVVYDFEAAAAAGENPGNKNGSSANGQAFYGWENSYTGYTDRVRQDYKGYEFSTGSVLPRRCHVWRRSDRINGNVNTYGGLNCPSDKQMAIDSLTAGMMVVIIFDSSAVTADSKQMLWAIGDGTTSGGPGHPRATATIGGVEAVPGVTPIRSGDTIIVTSVTPAANGTGYIVFQVKMNMVIKQIAVWEAPEPPAPAVPHTVRFASGNDGWTMQDVTASASATAPAVLENVMAGDSLVVTAPTTLPGKVKSVKAVKYVAPAATVTTAPTATAAIIEVGSTAALVEAGAANGGTMMYAVTTTNTKPTSTDGFSATIPTAEGRTAGTYYVWYYVKADANHSDSEIDGPVSVTLAVMTTVTINQSDWGTTGKSFTKDGVTVSVGSIDRGSGNLMAGGTFSTTLGKFTRIVVTTGSCEASGTGWSGSYSSMTWAGTPASTVSFSGNFMGMGMVQTTFVCTIASTN